MIKLYSRDTQANDPVSKNFVVDEFRCPDGSDMVRIDSVLVDYVQAARDYFGVPVYIRSGYRSASYNKLIGGAVDSDHLTGGAADIDVGSGKTEVDAKIVSMFFEARGCVRIGCYKYASGESWVHVGSYPGRLIWYDTALGIRTRPDTFIPELRKQFIFYTVKLEVKVVQVILQAKGLYTGKIDGKFGPATFTAVVKFQRNMKIDPDGVVGPITWNRLFI